MKNIFFFLLILGVSSRVFSHEKAEKEDFAKSFWMASSETGKNETLKEFSAGDENFRLIAANGRSYAFTSFTDRDFIVLIAYQQSANRWDRKAVLTKAAEMALELGQSGHVLLLQLGRAERNTLYNETKNSPFTVLMDTNEVIARSLKMKKIGDFLVFKVPEKKSTPVVSRAGSLFKENDFFSPLSLWDKMFSSRQLHFRIDKELNGKVLYGPDVRGAFERQCQYCHARYSEIDFYKTKNDFKYWARMNKFVMRTMRMPPTGNEPDAHYSLCDVNVKTNERDLRDRWLLQNWFESGSPFPEKAEFFPKSLEAKHPEPPAPDVIFKMKETHVVEASGTIDYKLATLAGPTKEDYYVKGFWGDFNLNVAHHVNIIVTDKIRAQLSMRKTTKPLDRDLAARDDKSDQVEEFVVATYSRRKGMARFPKGTAYFIPKGSYILLEFHYNPSGKREENKAELGLYLARQNELGHLQALNRMRIRRIPFTIPPGAKEYKVERVLPINEPITLIQAWSHSHFRAVASSITAELPDGSITPVCNTPYYQFKYEINSSLGKEVYLPAGSKIHSTIWYDNSEFNPANPDPNVAVSNGYQTDSQEMDIIRFVYVKGKLHFPLEPKSAREKQ